MRRDQSTTGSDYRREHNREMWERPGYVGLPIACHNYQARMHQAEDAFQAEARRPRVLSGSVLDAIEELGYCPVSRRAVNEQGIGD